MSGEEIAGAVIPVNLCVMYRFPYSTLEAAFRYFFGEASFELEKGEALGSPMPLREDLEFGEDEESFHHLCVLLTYAHEQFHLRHLSGSPTGLLLYFLEGRLYARLRSGLHAWGRRTEQEEDHRPRIPLLVHHVDDPEIESIAKTRGAFGRFSALFQGESADLTLREANEKVFPILFQEIETACASALQRKELYPDIRPIFPEQTVSLGPVTGKSVIEGLARCNEYIAAIQLGVPLHILNRYVAVKGHGVYNLTIGVAEKLLGLKPPDLWILVAKLSDWALQAPALPFLLDGRREVALEELLPAWRFSMLVSRFGQADFSVSDVHEREQEIAGVLFSGLGWESPWRVSERIRVANLSTPASLLTRHYVQNLQLSATIRENEPRVLSYPELGDQGHKLQAIYNLFADGFKLGSTGIFASEKDSWTIPTLLLCDTVVDALLMDKNLSRPMLVARHLADFLFDGHADAGKLVGDETVRLLGKTTALRLIDPMRNSDSGSTWQN